MAIHVQTRKALLKKPLETKISRKINTSLKYFITL